jgi:AraC-like DNA-binding protein
MAYDFHDLQRFQDEEVLHQSYSFSENILRLFMQHLHDPSQPFLKVNVYASLFHITPKYFSSICKRLTGRTANQLISYEIMRSAQISLRDSSKSIKQIAASLGFKNQSHFGRFFRLHTGVSPQQYREGKSRQ